jgi:hypothetical protein
MQLVLLTGSGLTQDGAGYDPAAAKYHPPELSLNGGAASPQLESAVVMLFTGDPSAAVSRIDTMAKNGDVKAAIFLGNLFRAGSAQVKANPNRARDYYMLASNAGSGEASEHIASMLEHHEIPAAGGESSEMWRAQAVRQGWVQQELSVYCLQWIHGPEPLRCTQAQPSDTKVIASEDGCPSSSEMNTLRTQGMTGTLSLRLSHTQHGDGPLAKAFLIMDRPVNGEQDLKEPYATTVVYVQKDDRHWQMLPAGATLLHRYVIIKPDDNLAHVLEIMAQYPDGSSSGGSCALLSQPQP